MDLEDSNEDLKKDILSKRTIVIGDWYLVTAM